MRRKLRILLIDREGMLRDGLCALIDGEDGLVLAGAVGRAAELRTRAPAERPDIILADFPEEGGGAEEIVAIARDRWAAVAVLMLTFRRDDESIEAALRAGADGYLLKTDTRAELLKAIETVFEGRRYMSPAIFSQGNVRVAGPPSHTGPAGKDGLSEREREVMRLIAQGLRTREIAERLSLSHKTVEKHRTNLMRKLGVRSAAAVAAYAISNGYMAC